jgi:hypothetical protein
MRSGGDEIFADPPDEHWPLLLSKTQIARIDELHAESFVRFVADQTRKKFAWLS